MYNEKDSHVLMKLLEISKSNPYCFFSLAGNPRSYNNVVDIRELAQRLEMNESEVTSAMRRLHNDGYLKYLETGKTDPKVYLFLSDTARVYPSTLESRNRIEQQRDNEIKAIQEISKNIGKQVKQAEDAANSAFEAEQRTRRISIISIAINASLTFLGIIVEVLIYLFCNAK